MLLKINMQQHLKQMLLSGARFHISDNWHVAMLKLKSSKMGQICKNIIHCFFHWANIYWVLTMWLANDDIKMNRM